MNKKQKTTAAILLARRERSSTVVILDNSRASPMMLEDGAAGSIPRAALAGTGVFSRPRRRFSICMFRLGEMVCPSRSFNDLIPET
jgi:hypothetical protein